MWVITKAIISVLNLVVTTCVMNQSQGHWLLSNALSTCIAPIVNMEVKFEQVFDGIEVQ